MFYYKKGEQREGRGGESGRKGGREGGRKYETVKLELNLQITELTDLPNIYMESEVTSCLKFYCEFFIFKK